MRKTHEDSDPTHLRIHPSFLGAPIVRRRLEGDQIRGTLILKQRLAERTAYISGLEGMAREAGSYRALLSGESKFSDLPAGQMHIPDKRVLHDRGLLDRSVLTFGAALRGPDYSRLQRESPGERYKFYSSLDLTTPAQVEIGTRWFGEVAERALQQGLSLTTKAFDHSYDSLNLYTWDPNPLADILSGLYPKYRDLGLYSATPHFLQGEIEGVDPDHIGYVQEPVSGYSGVGGGGSHSVRMGILGASVDSHLAAGQQLSPDMLVEAADAAGVNPARPYLLAK